MNITALHRRTAALVSAIALLAPGAAMAQAAATAAPAAPAAPIRSDAREQAPAALMGIWEVDIAASTFAGAAPARALRIFQYTEDAKIMVTFISVNAAGGYTYGHWGAAVDGSEALEFHSSYGATPYNIVTLKKVDDRNFDLQVLRNGKLDMTGSYQLSEDGETLTYKYAYGPRESTLVYRRWAPLA